MERGGYGAVNVYKRLLDQARPYWGRIGGILLLNLLATPLSLLKPLALKIAVDTVIGSKPLPVFLRPIFPNFLTSSPQRLLVAVAVLQVLVIVLLQLQTLAGYLMETKIGEQLTLDFRGRLFRHTQRLSLSVHDTRGSADSIYRIQYDAPAIQWMTVHGLLPFFSEGLLFISMIYVTAAIDWHLAMVALAVTPFLLLCARAYDRRMGPLYERLHELESRAVSVVQEVLTAVRVVKAFGHEDREQERFLRHSNESIRQRIELAVAEGAFGLAVNSTTAIGTALVLVVGVGRVLSGHLSLGDLLLVISYSSQLYGPLESISNQFGTMQTSLASARRAFEVLDAVPEVVEDPNALPLKCSAGAIEFVEVSFAYDRDVVLNNVSFKVPPGAKVGIVGRTGAGKTTLCSLLTRFYDVTSGQILLDGVDLRKYRLTDLRNQFALVLQDTVLFSTTIAENILYGRPGARAQEIVEAAKLANAHEFIMALPDGYQTRVGERGMLLSGGERQRISLARAFLKNAPILLLDEPTSGVDVRTEKAIMESIELLMQNRTSILISHRLSALEPCDLLLLIENGRVVEATSDVSAAIPKVQLLSKRDHRVHST